MDKLDHFILTRFNLNVAYGRPETRLDPAWLHDRFELFDRFCYPSVRGQSTQNFTWLVFFDSDTPRVFTERFAAYSRWKNFVPVYINAPVEEYHRDMRDAIITRMSDRAQSIVTTRLDNDDALGTRFVEKLHDALSEKENREPECVNFTLGYVWHRSKSKLYLANSSSNQFISFFERVDNFKTVYCIEHTRLSELSPVREVINAPLWLQVIHQKNAHTGVYGVRTPWKGLTGFTIDVVIPSQNDLLSCCAERGMGQLKRGMGQLKRMAKRLARPLVPRAIITWLRPKQ
jgi:hypothetical protein